jgi:hypothetical protein
VTEKLHPSTLARQQRITEAERLLAEGVPIAEVAVTLGYASVNSLQSTPTSRAMRLALAHDALAEGASEAEAARAAGYADVRALRRAIRETAAREGAQ